MDSSFFRAVTVISSSTLPAAPSAAGADVTPVKANAAERRVSLDFWYARCAPVIDINDIGWFPLSILESGSFKFLGRSGAFYFFFCCLQMMCLLAALNHLN